jgi:hypothetical protein
VKLACPHQRRVARADKPVADLPARPLASATAMDGAIRRHRVHVNRSVVGGAHMRRDATIGQLARAASGLEAIADTCAGARREDLLDLAADLHARVADRHAVERRRERVVERALGRVGLR